MGNLIKMDMRRLFHSPMFLISVSVIAVFNIVLNVGLSVLTKIFTPGAAAQPVNISDIIINPFFISLFLILVFVSMVSFSYADIANGYIKNIAGQLPNKSYSVYSKIIVIGIHNFIFLIAGSISNVIGYLILSAMKTVTIQVDAQVFPAIATLLVKWLLCMALSSILMFVVMGVRNKTLASVIGVIIGTGTLGLAYMGLNAAVSNIFKINGFDLAAFMPDALFGTVNVGTNVAVINSVVVSVVCIAIFLSLTVKVFNSRDIK